MSSSGGPTIDQIKVVNIVLPIIATVVTSFRLFERTRQGRLWLDDACAALAMIFIIILLVADWLYLNDYASYSQRTKVALYYMIAEFFYSVIWMSRMSILFTVLRMTIQGSLRKILSFLVMAFLVAFLVLFAQVFWTCEAEPGWKTQPRPQCELGRNVAIAQIITDVFGDAILILAPFRLIYKVRLSRAQKIRVLSIFSTSAITTVVSLAHAYYVLTGGGLRESVAAMIEVSVSLIVANLSVVVAFIFRISTEDTPAFSPPLHRSIITFGSQPIRKRAQQSTVTGIETAIETTIIRLDDLGSTVTATESIKGMDAEASSKLRKDDEQGLLYDA